MWPAPEWRSWNFDSDIFKNFSIDINSKFNYNGTKVYPLECLSNKLNLGIWKECSGWKILCYFGTRSWYKKWRAMAPEDKNPNQFRNIKICRWDTVLQLTFFRKRAEDSERIYKINHYNFQDVDIWNLEDIFHNFCFKSRRAGRWRLLSQQNSWVSF